MATELKYFYRKWSKNIADYKIFCIFASLRL